MASVKQIDLLVAGLFNSSGKPIAEGTVEFRQTGTNILATLYKDSTKTDTLDNPAKLSERGSLTAFADQELDMIIKDKNGNKVTPDLLGFTYDISTTQDFGIDATQFGTTQDSNAIQLAINSASGSPAQVFMRPTEWDIDVNLTVPSNINLLWLYGAFATIQGGVTLTYNGTWTPILFQIHRGAGTLTFDDRNNDVPSINQINGVHDDRTLDGKLLDGIHVFKDNPSVTTEVLRLDRSSDTPADNDSYEINYFSENDADEQIAFAKEELVTLDVSDGTEKGQLKWSVADGVDGSVDEVASLDIDNFNLSTNVNFNKETGIIASTTQSQGQQPLTKDYNEVLANNPGDVVTLPDAKVGKRKTIFNSGTTNFIGVFAASGDDFLSGAIEKVVIPQSVFVVSCVQDTIWLIESYYRPLTIIPSPPAVTGLGTVTDHIARITISNDLAMMTGKFVLGTPTAVEARIDLPFGLTTAGASDRHNFGSLDSSTNNNSKYYILGGSFNNFVTIGGYDISAPPDNILDNLLGTSIYSAGNTVSYTFTIPIR